MILPYLRGLLSPRTAPATWALVALNVFVYLGTLSAYESSQIRLDAILDEPSFVARQGLVFAQLIEREPQLFSASLGLMRARAQKGDPEARDLLGALALRNAQFVAHAGTYAFEGDEIAIASWRKRFIAATALQSEHPSYRWGLSHLNASGRNWITYQFAHSGFMHLALNMAFLLIFGVFVETRLGSSLVVLCYVFSGVAGAFAFTRLTGLTASPLVGASAAVSGLGGLVAVHCGRERIPFFFFVLPIQGYMGLRSFPAWLILLLFSVPDLAGFLSGVPDVSGVAYAAHLGGAAFGALMAGLLRLGLLAADPYDPEKGWGIFDG